MQVFTIYRWCNFLKSFTVFGQIEPQKIFETNLESSDTKDRLTLTLTI